MDPNATLERLLKALRDRDGDEACEAATDLINWLDRGGFEPEDLQACIDWHEENRDRFRDTDTDRAFDRLLGSFAQNQWRPRSGKTPADEACEAAEDLIEFIDQGAPPPRTLPGCLRIIAGEGQGERLNPAGGTIVPFQELASGGKPRSNPAGRRAGESFEAEASRMLSGMFRYLADGDNESAGHMAGALFDLIEGARRTPRQILKATRGALRASRSRLRGAAKYADELLTVLINVRSAERIPDAIERAEIQMETLGRAARVGDRQEKALIRAANGAAGAGNPRSNPEGIERVRARRGAGGSVTVTHDGQRYELDAGLGSEPYRVYRSGPTYWVVVRETGLPFVAVDVFDLEHHERTSRDPEGLPVERDPESSMAAQEWQVEHRFGDGWEDLSYEELIERAMR